VLPNGKRLYFLQVVEAAPHTQYIDNDGVAAKIAERQLESAART